MQYYIVNMKISGLLTFPVWLVLVCSCGELFGQLKNRDLIGAWQKGGEENRTVWINSEKHFSAAVYNIKEKQFLGAYGGEWKIEGNALVAMYEFNTINPELIGKEVRREIEIMGDKLALKAKEGNQDWIRVDNGTPGKLAGAWVITGRVTAGEFRKMTPGARKTMKILSGTRFQWIAFNSETKEFSGTGGGTYTTENGKYVEKIDLFSRDNSRIGMSLEFNFSLEDGNWRHSGKSSKGEPIDEIWTLRERLGI